MHAVGLGLLPIGCNPQFLPLRLQVPGRCNLVLKCPTIPQFAGIALKASIPAPMRVGVKDLQEAGWNEGALWRSVPTHAYLVDSLEREDA